jgi:hypothetical protein
MIGQQLWNTGTTYPKTQHHMPEYMNPKKNLHADFHAIKCDRQKMS